MAIPPPPITPVPTPAPQRGDRATFSDRVDAFVTWLEGATAEFEAVAQNTYDNATIAEGSGDVASVGLGITTAGPFMPNIDNAAVAAGFWYVDATSIGTFPSVGALPGMLFHRIYGTGGFQMYQPFSLDRIFYRRRVGGAFQTWNEFAKGGVNTDITQLNAVQHIGMAATSPSIDFDETDQTGAAGLWRWTFQGDAWNFVKNTAVAGDFSTSTSMLSASASGAVQINGYTPVQQGTGVGQGSNTVKIGWGTSSGLKLTIDNSDQGFIATSSTNPFSGGTITYNNPLTALAGNFTTVTASGLVSANAGLQVNNNAALMLGGALATLGNNGFMQINGSGGLNLVFDYTNVQARSNGSAATLNLNSLGGLVQIGSGGAATTGNIIAGSLYSSGRIQARDNSGDDKIQLMLGPSTTHGFITAAAGHCFGVVNAAHSLQACTLDNSGNFTAAGNITANSDERLKKNWRDLPEDFLDRLADIALIGLYDRIDIDETQIGMSAQQVQAFAPQLVVIDPKTGALSLDYGKLGAVASALLARRQRKEINELKALIEKAGKA